MIRKPKKRCSCVLRLEMAPCQCATYENFGAEWFRVYRVQGLEIQGFDKRSLLRDSILGLRKDGTL